MNRQRKFILLTAAIGIISVFLPWITISIFGVTESVNGFHGSGVLVFILFLTTGIITWMGNQDQPLEKNAWFVVLLCGAIALVSAIIKITSSSGSIDGEIGLPGVGLGLGVWLAIASSAGIILFAWLFKRPADNLKNGFEGLKKSISIPASSLSDAAIKPNSSVSLKIDEFERLSKLKNNGSISEEEYQQLKSKLM